jgi:hypothetical protein
MTGGRNGRTAARTANGPGATAGCGRGLGQPCVNRAFYEAVFVKSKLSFSCWWPAARTFHAYLLRLSFLPSLGCWRFLWAMTSWVNPCVVAFSTGGFAVRDAGSFMRSPATTFYSCRPSGRCTRVCIRPLAIRRSLVPGRPISSTVALAQPPGTCVRSPGPVLDATKPSFHPDGSWSPFALFGNTVYICPAW